MSCVEREKRFQQAAVAPLFLDLGIVILILLCNSCIKRKFNGDASTDGVISLVQA